MLISSTLLAFSAAFLVLFEPATPSAHNHTPPGGVEWPLTMQLDLDSEECDAHFVGILPTLQYLVENALTGGEFFACGAGTDISGWFWILSMLFYAVSGLLMLNMCALRRTVNHGHPTSRVAPARECPHHEPSTTQRSGSPSAG